jgi:predicted transcriptional regulator
MGGWYVDTELIEQLGGVDVSTYYRALHQLADLGMITYTDRNRGPQSPYSYRRIDPIVTSTMWDVLGLRIFGVGA